MFELVGKGGGGGGEEREKGQESLGFYRKFMDGGVECINFDTGRRMERIQGEG